MRISVWLRLRRLDNSVSLDSSLSLMRNDKFTATWKVELYMEELLRYLDWRVCDVDARTSVLSR